MSLRISTLETQTHWRAPPRTYSVPEDEVHVWRATLNRASECITALREVLSPDEHEKAARFHFDVDRRRFVLGRGALRKLLGECIGMAPEKLRFDYSSFGKPSLAAGVAETPLRFNVSHSGDLILIAIGVRRALGVDVERIRKDIAVTGIAEQFFSPAERSALLALDPSSQYDAFYACWTRKEAYIKAAGGGLSLPLDQFDVSFLPGEPARLVATRPNAAEAHHWMLLELDAGQDYKAAVAIEGEGFHLKTWDWHARSRGWQNHRA